MGSGGSFLGSIVGAACRRLLPTSAEVNYTFICSTPPEHSSTRPRFATHHLPNVSLQIANKLGNLKKKKVIMAWTTLPLPTSTFRNVWLSLTLTCPSLHFDSHLNDFGNSLLSFLVVFCFRRNVDSTPEQAWQSDKHSVKRYLVTLRRTICLYSAAQSTTLRCANTSE
jgi:hypothetical protein